MQGKRSWYVRASRVLLHLEKRKLEKSLSGGFDTDVSLELDAVLTALEALSGEQTEEEGTA